MKPKFTYLYISFILSLAVLVILSFLFYKRLDSHLKYTSEVEGSYSILYKLKDLEEKMMELDSYSRGYMLTGDSAFVRLYSSGKDSVFLRLDDLQGMLADNSFQLSRLQLMRSTVISQLNVFEMNMHRMELEQEGDRRASLLRGKNLMDTFQMEARQIEFSELKQRADLLSTKEYYEDFYPNYFNTISIWAGIITLVSFFFINREVRMRTRYQHRTKNSEYVGP